MARNDQDQLTERLLRTLCEPLIGGRVKEARLLTQKEAKTLELDEFLGGSNPLFVVILDNGFGFIPMADPEGNGPGFLEVCELSQKTPAKTGSKNRGVNEGMSAVQIMDEFVMPRGLCSLCGNSGHIDTRGKVFSPAGVECGSIMYCVCPNGRALKNAGHPLPGA